MLMRPDDGIAVSVLAVSPRLPAGIGLIRKRRSRPRPGSGEALPKSFANLMPSARLMPSPVDGLYYHSVLIYMTLIAYKS